MTADRNLKRRVRARAARTGESYTAALRQFRPATLRLAVAQTTVHEGPTGLAEVRHAMQDARDAGARLVHLTEGAAGSPHKLRVDWTRFDWTALRHELAAVQDLARRLRLWTVLGAVHPQAPPARPHNSLYVISDRGRVTARYDERMLSRTKVTSMYTPGSAPVTFEAHGFRFGCALGMESQFAEVFAEYERLDVDCVLFSTTGPGAATPALATPGMALQAQAHAAGNSYWVSYAGTAQDAPDAPAGIVSPDGEWAARCPREPAPALAVAELDHETGRPARQWRRTARARIVN